MAARLVDQFGPEVVDRIAATLPVPPTPFRRACLDGFDDLGLMQRAARIAEVMHEYLDPDPATAVGQVHASLGRERPPGMGAFFYNPHSTFIGRYGPPAFDASMAAMHDLTKVFTAEFCIRPFLLEHPATLERLRTWTDDPDEHVRRLVSEGTRPRLPWAQRLQPYIDDPEPVIALLELLKDDPSEYVRRSVGNNLNDISKDHPQRVLEVARTWLPGRPRLVRRGLRTLIKAGDARALSLLGYSPAGVVARVAIPERVTIGQTLQVQVELTGDGPVLVDLVVYFVRADAMASRKVFKGVETIVRGTATFRRSISFERHSTRIPRPGVHRIAALVNGEEQALGSVELVDNTDPTGRHEPSAATGTTADPAPMAHVRVEHSPGKGDTASRRP